jgi:hypothetical protein
MAVSLISTIGPIVLGTSVVGYIRARITDRCLRSLNGFQVTLHKTDGKRVWGRMHLTTGGRCASLSVRPPTLSAMC